MRTVSHYLLNTSDTCSISYSNTIFFKFDSQFYLKIHNAAMGITLHQITQEFFKVTVKALPEIYDLLSGNLIDNIVYYTYNSDNPK